MSYCFFFFLMILMICQLTFIVFSASEVDQNKPLVILKFPSWVQELFKALLCVWLASSVVSRGDFVKPDH